VKRQSHWFLQFQIQGHTSFPRLVNSFRRLTRYWGSGENDSIVTGERKSRRNIQVLHAPRGMIDHSCANLYTPPDDRVYGWLDALAPECRIPNHVEQIVGNTSDEKPCLISCKPMATRFVPSKGILPLFYSVFNLGTTIVDRNYFVRLKIRVGHNKSDSREEFTHVPFDFTDNPSRFTLFLRLVTQLDHLHLYPALWGTTDGASRSVEYEPFEAVVGGEADKVGDALPFAELVEIWTGKCRIPPEPKLLKPGSVAIDQRRNEIDDAIG